MNSPISISSRQDLRDWLERHHTETKSVWIVRASRSAADADPLLTHVPNADVVKECLCFGWIDSTVKKVDADHIQTLISPRRPNSMWSILNRSYIRQLIDEGQMQPAGLAAIARAKKSGTWLDEDEELRIPDDFRSALSAVNPQSVSQFEQLSVSRRHHVLFQIRTSKQDQTRSRRIAKFVDEIVSKCSAGNRIDDSNVDEDEQTGRVAKKRKLSRK